MKKAKKAKRPVKRSVLIGLEIIGLLFVLDTGLILFVSTRSHKRMIAKGKQTALLNDKFSRAVLLALFFFSPGYIVFRFFPVIAGTRPVDFPFKVFFPGNLPGV